MKNAHTLILMKTIRKSRLFRFAREYEIALSWLIDCGLVYQVNRVNACKVPLSAYQDFNAFKLYMLDVGLLCAMAKLDAISIIEGNDIFVEFKGALTEQYVLTELKTSIDSPMIWNKNKCQNIYVEL